MPSDLGKERFPQTIYEAENYEEIVKPQAGLVEKMRGTISDTFKYTHLYEKASLGNDAIMRIIRVFEFEDKIFVTNRKMPAGSLKFCPSDVICNAYIRIQAKILANLKGPYNGDNLKQLWDSLDSIVVDMDGRKIKNVTLLWKELSMNEIKYFDSYRGNV